MTDLDPRLTVCQALLHFTQPCGEGGHPYLQGQMRKRGRRGQVVCPRLHSLSCVVPAVLRAAPQEAPLEFWPSLGLAPSLCSRICAQMWHWALLPALWPWALTWIQQAVE